MMSLGMASYHGRLWVMSRTGLEGTAVPSERTNILDTLGLMPAHKMFLESQEGVGARVITSLHSAFPKGILPPRFITAV